MLHSALILTLSGVISLNCRRLKCAGSFAGSAEPLSQRRSEEGLGKPWASPSRAPGGGIFGERSLLSRSSTLGMAGALGAKGGSRGEPWEIDPAEIKIMQRSDGGPWVLGEGASGSVSSAS